MTDWQQGIKAGMTRMREQQASEEPNDINNKRLNGIRSIEGEYTLDEFLEAVRKA